MEFKLEYMGTTGFVLPEPSTWSINPTAVYIGGGKWYFWPGVMEIEGGWWDVFGWSSFKTVDTKLERVVEVLLGLVPQLAVTMVHSQCDAFFINRKRDALLQPERFRDACATKLVYAMGSRAAVLRNVTWQSIRDDCAEGQQSRTASLLLNQRIRDVVQRLPGRSRVSIVDAFNLTDGRCEYQRSRVVLSR